METTNKLKKRNLRKILAVCIFAVMLLVAGGLVLLQGQALVSHAHADASSDSWHQYDGVEYTIEDIRQMLNQNSLHQYQRVHTYEGGVDIYQMPIDDYLSNDILMSINAVAPMSAL